MNNMERWRNKYLNLGEINEKSKVLFHFDYLGDKEDIVKITPLCKSCTKIKGWSDNRLNIVFKANKIPQHINKSYLVLNKVIIVEYQNGSKERLNFSVRIKK